MRHFFLTILLLLSITLGYAQHYKVHSATKGVKVECSGKTVEATVGMPLKASDNLVIPQGGVVEVLNTVDKHIYRSVQSGRVSVTKMIIEAKRTAGDKLTTVTDRMRFGKDSRSKGKRVYVDKGVVNRSLAVYDPEGQDVEMDAVTLARAIAAQLRTPSQDTLPAELRVKTSESTDSRFSFDVENDLTYPIYFNLLDVIENTAEGKTTVEISGLGQPDRSYVLLPGHFMTRGCKHNTRESGKKMSKMIMLITTCRFNLDELIDELNKALSSDADAPVEEDLPLYIYPLNY